MVLELFKNKKIALLASFFLAISPWHLQFSRVAFETNSAIFWSVLALWAFLRGIRSNGLTITAWMTLSAFAFSANLYMYHNSRVFVPLFTLVLFALFYKQILKIKKHFVLPVLITLFAIAFLIPIALSDAGQVRFKGTAVFGDLSPVYKESQLILDDEKDGQLHAGKILHNRRLVYVPIIIENYFSHFRPSFLFFEADMDRHHAPLIGLLYIWDLVFIITGIYFFIKEKIVRSTKILIFWWFAIAPVASSVTWGVPHALRAEIYLPIYQVFIAVGCYYLFLVSKVKRMLVFIAPLLVLNFFVYLHQYHIHLPLEYSESWKYGRKEAVLHAASLKSTYDRVIVSTKLEQPYMFWLYYLKYDPALYLQEGGTVSGSFKEERNRFDKYLFKQIDYNNQKSESKTLFVGYPEEFPEGASILKKINYLNGTPAIYVAE